jgi:hypothetical protein
MKASLLYRIASVLLLLFAIGHTLGFRQTNPAWGVASLIDSMRSIHFDAQGFSRTYWDFFSAFGFFSLYFFCSPRYWRGSWPAFRQRFEQPARGRGSLPASQRPTGRHVRVRWSDTRRKAQSHRHWRG